MKRKNNLRLLLVLGLSSLSLAGWLLHLQLHSISEDTENLIPAAAGVLSVFIIPILFIFRRTTPVAYLINGMTVIIGTIAMITFSLEHPPEVWNVQSVLFGTLFADIILLWGKFALGKALFDMEQTLGQPETVLRKGRFFRYPNMGFWLAHIVSLSILYTIGHQYWK